VILSSSSEFSARGVRASPLPLLTVQRSPASSPPAARVVRVEDGLVGS
jgi:hypothetical protein